jgi:hypothetical protein
MFSLWRAVTVYHIYNRNAAVATIHLNRSQWHGADASSPKVRTIPSSSTSVDLTRVVWLCVYQPLMPRVKRFLRFQKTAASDSEQIPHADIKRASTRIRDQNSWIWRHVSFEPGWNFVNVKIKFGQEVCEHNSKVQTKINFKIRVVIQPQKVCTSQH